MKKKMTAHEKKVEIAKASAPSYGIYIDGGCVEKLAEAIALVSPTILGVIDSDSEERTKRLALEILKDALPKVSNCNFNEVNVSMGNGE